MFCATRRVLAIVILYMLACSGSAYSQGRTPTPTPVPANPEVAVLRAQLETMRQFQQDILSTVWWSLGTMVAVAALLTGYSWFSSRQLYDRDKQRLQQELREHAEQVAIKAARDAARASAQTVTQQVAHEVSQFRAQQDSLRRDVLRTRIQLAQSAAEQHRASGVYGNVVTTYNGMLEYALDLDDQILVSDALEGIQSGLRDILGKGQSYVDADDAKSISDNPARLPGSYSVEVENTRRLLIEVRARGGSHHQL